MKMNKEDIIFSLEDRSKIAEGKKEIAPNELKKGMAVSIEYRKEKNRLVGDAINVSALKVEIKQVTPVEKTTERKE
jgi:hypothetical protein